MTKSLNIAVNIVIWLVIACSLLFVTNCTTTTTNSDGTIENTVIDKKRLSNTYVELATEYQRRNAPQVALDRANLAISTNEDNAKAYMVRAMIYQNLKQTKEAQKDFLTAIELGGTKYSEAFVNYAVFLCEQRRYTEAFEYFHTALNNPTYYNPEVAHYNIGMCYARNHQRESAIHELLLAIDYRNPPQNTYIALANLELLDKHFTLANYHINKYSDTQTPDILWLRIQILQGLIDSSKNNATYIQYRDVIATVLRNNYSNSDAFLAYVKFYKQHELSPKKPILFPVKITTPLNITTPVATKQIPAIVHSLRMADTHKQQSQPLYVIVKHGDTLYSIANKYKVATTVLIKINHLKHNIVPLGSKIYLK